MLVEKNTKKFDESINIYFERQSQFNFFITSELAFNKLNKKIKNNMSSHYFLRRKDNLGQIAVKINTNFIKDVKPEVDNFPVAVKPKVSGNKDFPFKFKVVDNKNDLNDVLEIKEKCISIISIPKHS